MLVTKMEKNPPGNNNNNKNHSRWALTPSFSDIDDWLIFEYICS